MVFCSFVYPRVYFRCPRMLSCGPWGVFEQLVGSFGVPMGYLGLPWEVIGLSFACLLGVASHPGHLKGLRVGFSSILCVIVDGLCFPVRLSTQARRCCKSNCREYSYNKRTHAL